LLKEDLITKRLPVTRKEKEISLLMKITIETNLNEVHTTIMMITDHKDMIANTITTNHITIKTIIMHTRNTMGINITNLDM
jgi:hypothetical protein